MPVTLGHYRLVPVVGRERRDNLEIPVFVTQVLYSAWKYAPRAPEFHHAAHDYLNRPENDRNRAGTCLATGTCFTRRDLRRAWRFR